VPNVTLCRCQIYSVQYMHYMYLCNSLGALVDIVTAKINGYIVLVTDQIKIVTISSFSLPNPTKNWNSSIVPVTCPSKKLKLLHRSCYLSPNKIVTGPSFSLLTLPKKCNGFIFTVTWLLKDAVVPSFPLQILNCNCYIVLVS
jgi:hypothetical protein